MGAPPLAVAGLVLAGGRSRRMGRPKEWLACDDRAMLRRVVDVVASAASPVIVSARPGQELPALPAGVEVVPDLYEGCGPLEGVLRGLQALDGRATAAFVCACDYPLMTAATIRRLIEHLNENDEFDGVVPEVEGRPHPLAAVYRAAVAGAAREALLEGERRVRAWVSRLRTRRDDVDAWPDAAQHRDSFLNVNAPDDYDRMVEALRSPRDRRRTSQ